MMQFRKQFIALLYMHYLIPKKQEGTLFGAKQSSVYEELLEKN
jgi:hypothetical protein